MNCGLLGRKLSHSYSPQIHAQLGDYDYALFEQEPEALETFLRSDQFSGINVTIPYKKSVTAYCETLTESARRLGAVNTIVRKPDGTLLGHNSDYFGFRSMVEKTGLSVSGKKALVLGSGGASVTAVAVLQDMGANTVTISRNGPDNYLNLEKHKDARLIVNATPVGMYPETGVSPVSPDLFPELEGVLDLIYNPARTKLLLTAEERGLVAENGLWMLVAQAKESAEFFTGKAIPDSVIPEIYGKLQSQMQNIILIGMPGCGKTTVGKLVAEKLGRAFLDSDDEIFKVTGRTPAQIISQDGESAFRTIETEILSTLGKRSGLVIATGGGCITRDENYPLLHQNGKIFWLQRPLSGLATEDRPLSARSGVEALYRIRKPMYERFADCTIHNDRSAQDAVQQILQEVSL